MFGFFGLYIYIYNLWFIWPFVLHTPAPLTELRLITWWILLGYPIFYSSGIYAGVIVLFLTFKWGKKGSKGTVIILQITLPVLRSSANIWFVRMVKHYVYWWWWYNCRWFCAAVLLTARVAGDDNVLERQNVRYICTIRLCRHGWSLCTRWHCC
jgi:hypothetical protein